MRRVPTWLWVSGGLIALMALSAFDAQPLPQRPVLDGRGDHDRDHSAPAVGQIPQVLRYDGNPPLYYMLLHVWMRAFGDSVDATHSLSLLFGLLTIPAGGWGGWRLFGRRAGDDGGDPVRVQRVADLVRPGDPDVRVDGSLGVLATTFFLLGFVERRRRWLLRSARC